MLGLALVAVHRSRFPVSHLPNGARQGFSQSLGRLLGTTHGELNLLVDVAGQTPGLILRPHEMRFLCVAFCTRVPSHSRRVFERFNASASDHMHSQANGRQVCAQGTRNWTIGALIARASAAPSGGGVLTDCVLSGGVIVASPEKLPVDMLLAALYW